MNNEDTIRVLLVEDDARIADLTRDYLVRNGLAVTVARNGDQGLEEALTGVHDILLLDIMLPGPDGIEICRRVRERSDVPIIMLTARGEEADRVLGLELGADDYVAKPFSARELLARIRSQIRRFKGRTGPRSRHITVGTLVIDPATRRATFDGRYLDLTGYEFSLLHALAERAGQVLSRDRLMELAKGSREEAFDRSVDVHISKLRQKLGDKPRHAKLIKTVRGVGYQLLAERE